MIHRATGGAFGCKLGSEGRALARALKVGRAGATPAQDVPIRVGQRDNRVVEGRLDVGVTARYGLPFPPSSTLLTSPLNHPLLPLTSCLSPCACRQRCDGRLASCERLFLCVDL